MTATARELIRPFQPAIYGRIECPYCDGLLSTYPPAFIGHMRWHVRQGIAREMLQDGRRNFPPTPRGLSLRMHGRRLAEPQSAVLWQNLETFRWSKIHRSDAAIASAGSLLRCGRWIPYEDECEDMIVGAGVELYDAPLCCFCYILGRGINPLQRKGTGRPRRMAELQAAR